MTSKTGRLTGHSVAATAIFLALAFAAPSALAQTATTTTASTTPTSSTHTQSITTVVTVKSIDMGNRHMVVTSASGDEFAMKVPAEVHNLDKIKVGDKIRATYTRETELVISKGNAPLPPDSETTLAARAAKGELPAGAVANHIVVTGAVLGIDMANHTLKVVNPQGGQVHTIYVSLADRQKAMSQLKVGDKITAYVTESLLLSVHPA
jgi:hypothetical protein